jgi:DNA excision repair protein ERCC-2
MLFPHEKKRESQSELIKDIEISLENKKPILFHAPTGLGKTAASLTPTLKYAIENNKKIFFLTSRHTQQKIVIETIKKINERHNKKIRAIGMIGKKQMCSQEKTENLNTTEFGEYCKALIEDKACTYYENSRKKTIQEFLQEQIKNKDAEETIKICKSHYACPYEISTQAAKNSDVIIGDYYYIFHPHIRKIFLTKIKKELKDIIIIIDEAHNLPNRLRKLSSRNLSTIILSRALNEAKKNSQEHLIPYIETLNSDLKRMSEGFPNGEKLVRKSEIHIEKKEETAEEFDEAAKKILLEKKKTSMTTIANFLYNWKEEKGYSRILKKEGDFIMIKHNCIDPSIQTKDIFEESHSIIAMSGTLRPLEMYRDILGFPKETTLKEYSNPFPDKNRLSIIFPRTTTKYSNRNEEQYYRIGKIAAEIANSIPGKTAIFFPSYNLRDSVLSHFEDNYEGKIFLEEQGTQKEEKEKLLQEFKQSLNGTLLGAATGSFGEGIDLPGVLKGVIMIGLPLEKPDLETQQKIEYYEDKFKKGWDYGYILPAMTTSFQNAGRCIRTEKDKGVMIFIDERFSWPNYFKSFPKEWNIKITLNPIEIIDEFFKE